MNSFSPTMQQVFLHNTSAQYLDSHTSHVTDPNDVVRKFLRRKNWYDLKLNRMTLPQIKLEFESGVNLLKRFENIKLLRIVGIILFSNEQETSIDKLIESLSLILALTQHEPFQINISRTLTESSYEVIMNISRANNRSMFVYYLSPS